MKTNKFFIWIFVLISLVSFVFAQGVNNPVTEFIGDTGLNLEVANPLFLEIGETGNAIVHVFNLSGGYIFSDNEAECNSIVAYPNGSILADINSISVSDYYLFNLSLAGLTQTGQYSWTIHCNTSNLGGYKTGYFEVVENRAERFNNHATQIIYVFIFIIIVLIFFGTLVESSVIKFLFYLYSGLQILTVFYFVYLYHMRRSVEILLEINWQIMLLFFGIIALYSIFKFMYRLVFNPKSVKHNEESMVGNDYSFADTEKEKKDKW